MKILFYFGGFAPIGGIETFCKNLLVYLQSKNFDCNLLYWGRKTLQIEVLENSNIKTSGIAWRWGCRLNIPDWLLLPLGLNQIKHVDVVLFGKLFPIQILKRLRRKAGFNTKFAYITPYRPLPPATMKETERLLNQLNHFDLILVQSSLFKEDLRKIGYLGAIEIVSYIPSNLPMLNDYPSTQEFKVGFLGRFEEDKNVSLLIKSFKEFQILFSTGGSISNTLQTSLHLFGQGSLGEELKTLTIELGIESSVFFHGKVTNSRVEEAIASCHLFAFSSTVEGQPLAALEIWSCGRAIVATPSGAFPEILSDRKFGKLTPHGDTNEFAKALLEVALEIQIKKLTPQVIRAAYLSKFSPEKIGARWIHILASLQ